MEGIRSLTLNSTTNSATCIFGEQRDTERRRRRRRRRGRGWGGQEEEEEEEEEEETFNQYCRIVEVDCAFDQQEV